MFIACRVHVSRQWQEWDILQYNLLSKIYYRLRSLKGNLLLLAFFLKPWAVSCQTEQFWIDFYWKSLSIFSLITHFWHQIGHLLQYIFSAVALLKIEQKVRCKNFVGPLVPKMNHPGNTGSLPLTLPVIMNHPLPIQFGDQGSQQINSGTNRFRT